MDEKKQKKSGGLMALVVLLLIITIVSVIIATYGWAKYQTAESGNTTANVANWNIGLTEGTAVIEKYQYVKTDMIAPGTEGHYTFNISGDSDVAFKYIVKIDEIKNKPTHLRFYALDVDGTTKHYFDELDGALGANATSYIDNVELGDTLIDDATPTGDKYKSKFAEAGKSLTVYWEWPYNDTTTPTPDYAKQNETTTNYAANHVVSDYDNIDVQDSAKTPMEFRVTLVATQVTPVKQ